MELLALVEANPETSESIKTKLQKSLNPGKKRKTADKTHSDGPRRTKLKPGDTVNILGVDVPVVQFPEEKVSPDNPLQYQDNDPLQHQGDDRIVLLHLPKRPGRGFTLPADGLANPSVLPTWFSGLLTYNKLATQVLKQQELTEKRLQGAGDSEPGQGPPGGGNMEECNRGAVSRSNVVQYLVTKPPKGFSIGKGPSSSITSLEIARQGAELANIYLESPKYLNKVGKTFKKLFILGKALHSHDGEMPATFVDIVQRCSATDVQSVAMKAIHAIYTCLLYSKTEMENHAYKLKLASEGTGKGDEDQEEEEDDDDDDDGGERRGDGDGGGEEGGRKMRRSRETCLKKHFYSYHQACTKAGLDAVTYPAFLNYHATGERLFPLAVSGSFYLLIVAAITGSLTSLRLVATPNCRTTLADIFRNPTLAQDGLRNLIVDCIIPNMSNLSTMAPFKIPTFSNDPKIGSFIDSTDLKAMDRYFNTGGFDTRSLKNFTRNSEVWHPFTSVEVSESPPQASPSPTPLASPNLNSPPTSSAGSGSETPPPDYGFKTISPDQVRDYVRNTEATITTVKLAVRLSKKDPPPYGRNADKAKIELWTEEMREKFSDPNNYVKATPENIQSLVDDLYENGKLKKDAKFVYIDSKCFPKGVIDLLIEDVEGKDPKSPSKVSIYNLATELMKSHWRAKLDAIYGDLLTQADTAKLEEIILNVAHFVWYNRFNLEGPGGEVTTKEGGMVEEYPRNHPAADLMQIHHVLELNPEKEANRKLGQNNLVPRLSKESVQHVSEYVKLIEGLSTWFTYASAVMERFDPSMYNKLVNDFAGNLPGTTTNPFQPHGGCAVNLDALTIAHTDPCDSFGNCMTGPFGSYSGGEIVLHSLGLIIKVETVEWTSFPSADVVHYNCHYVGQRGSAVLHTDKHGHRWKNGHNGHGGIIMKPANNPA